MIVKTGANYQAEGGYIEASTAGGSAVVKVENKEIVVPSVNGIADSVVPCVISKVPELTSNIIITAISLGDNMHTGGYSINTSERTLGITFNVGCSITINPAIPIKLADSSKDCTITTASGTIMLKATGDNPVAILEAA